jgi:putative ABC transport system permease protein
MLHNYIKIALRSITRSLSYTVINVSGLALGITCALLIFSLVSYNLNFDNFHHDADRIYRFVTEQHRDQVSYAASVPPAFGSAFREDYTYGEKVARICTLTEQLITLDREGDVQKFREEISFAEPEFFDIFNFPIISGKRDGLLRDPNTAIISERISKKYFGDQSPIGKTLRLGSRIEFTIAGVLKEIPGNTDLHSEIYLSYSTIKQYNEWYAADDAWGGITTDIQTFVRLQPQITPAEVERVLPAYVKKYRAESKNVHHYKLQPLNDIHFNSDYGGRMSKSVLWALSVIGFILIFTACLNFINLATAQAANRSKEVGVRKTLGSARSQLFWQFTAETGLIVILAFLLAVGASYSIIPSVNEFLHPHISLNLSVDLTFVLFSVALIVVITLLAGSYPGMILSGFKPVLALKGHLAIRRSGNLNLRRILIIAQFTISQIMLIGLLVIVYQMKYFRQTDMGFDKDAIVMIPVGSHDLKMNTLKEQFLQLPDVEQVSLCFSAPASESMWSTLIFYDNRTEQEAFAVSFRGADKDYISAFDIDLVEGRNLTPSDTVREFLVNETLVRKLGHSSPDEILGKTISMQGGEWKGPVVGVLKDFHDRSLRSDINPIVISTSSENYHEYAVKIRMAEAKETLVALEKTWTNMYPELMYEYSFLDDQTARFYQAEEIMLTIIQVFSFIALFIGCLGLYGLVSFMAVQKTKEIGIRKVLGGNVSQILWIFGKEFSRLVAIAFLMAAPIGWMLMSLWLENYAYHVDLTVWIFAFEISIILVIVLVTVGYTSLRAALANPVNSLRTE